VDDALAEAGIGGELVVEVEAVRVAADRGERADIRVGERLLERDGVADADVIGIVDGAIELPVEIGVLDRRDRRGGPVRFRAALAVDGWKHRGDGGTIRRSRSSKKPSRHRRPRVRHGSEVVFASVLV